MTGNFTHMSRRRNTIAEVARRAGVSVGTVSNVFNEKGRFAESTRQRVLKAAAEANFAPNALIRSLQSGTTGTVGVFTWPIEIDIIQDVTMHLLQGISRGLAPTGQDVLLYSRHPPESVAAGLFQDGRVDALILCPGGLSMDGVEELGRGHLPVVLLYHDSIPADMAAVNVDNRSGVLAAMDHLIGLGHRRIAFCGPDFTPDFRERRRAYMEGLELGGITPDPVLDVEAGRRQGEPAVTCSRLLALADPPTALIAGDDSIALALMAELRSRGIRIPSDISLVGFDDAPAAAAPPGLSTIRQPAGEVGRIAAEFASGLLSGVPGPLRALLPTELVVRGTTAPPAER